MLFGLNVHHAAKYNITQTKSVDPRQSAFVAQMVERKTLNLVVVGSIPIEGAFLFESVFFQYIYIYVVSSV